jgi:lambda family phage portal protein
MMSWIDGIFENIAPVYALKREIARARLQRLKRFYAEGEKNRRSIEAISGNRLNKDFLAPHNSAISAIEGSLETLRNHIRQNEYNNGHFAGPIQRWANHVIGRGLRFQSRVKADESYTRLSGLPRLSAEFAKYFNATVEKKFAIWNKQADKCLIQTHYEMQHLAAATKYRDGEVLIIGRKSNKKQRLIPYCQEIIEIDRLRTPTEIAHDPREKNKVRNGIRFDEEGAVKSYYVLKRHPGDSLQLGLKVEDYEEIPAWNDNGTKKVMHLMRIIRPEQTRGLSHFAAALKGMQTTFRYSEAEMFAALEDACMVGIVTTPNPVAFQAGHTAGTIPGEGNEEGNTERYHEFAANKWYYMHPGQQVQVRTPNRPNEKFDEIIQAFSRDPANALDMPLEIMLQKYSDINYSNARTIILMFYVPIILEQAYFMDHSCEPTYENVLNDLVATGQIQAPGYIERKEDYLESEWTPPKREWIDPEKEAKGKKEELMMWATNPYAVCAAKGDDFDQNAEAFARALKKVKELEEREDIKFPASWKEEGPKQTEEGQGQEGQNQNKQKGKVIPIKGK